MIDLFYQFSYGLFYNNAMFVLYLRVFSILICILVTLYLFIKKIVYSKTINEQFKKYATVITTIVLFFYIVEICFSFKAKSHSIGYSLASLTWYNKYWKPINNNGFRDGDKPKKKNKRNVVFIGDSFTAGAGIKNIKNRFSNIFQQSRQNYNIYNCGKSGIDTKQEIDILVNSTLSPNVIVWQYFFNDIEGAMTKKNINYLFQPMSDISGIQKFFATNTFTFNYLYWLRPHQDLNKYVEAFENGIKDSLCVKEHKKDLDFVIDYCSKNKIKLIVVVFPIFIFNENHPFNTFTKRITRYFNEKEIQCIDVSLITQNLVLSGKVVNNLDMHASCKVNKLVADELLKIIN